MLVNFTSFDAMQLNFLLPANSHNASSFVRRQERLKSGSSFFKPSTHNLLLLLTPPAPHLPPPALQAGPPASSHLSVGSVSIWLRCSAVITQLFSASNCSTFDTTARQLAGIYSHERRRWQRSHNCLLWLCKLGHKWSFNRNVQTFCFKMCLFKMKSRVLYLDFN